MGGEGAFDDAGDVCEAEVAGQEVLNGDLIGGAEDGGEGAAVAARFQGQAEAGIAFHVRCPEVQGADAPQVQAGDGGAGHALRVGEGALYR